MKRHQGAVVKQVDDRVLAAFEDCEVALGAAIALAETVGQLWKRIDDRSPRGRSSRRGSGDDFE